jgi:hypothetical protein
MYIGEKVNFKPAEFICDCEGRLAHLPGHPQYVTGEIDYINREHRYYTIRFDVWGNTMHESFKF